MFHRYLYVYFFFLLPDLPPPPPDPESDIDPLESKHKLAVTLQLGMDK